MRNRHFFKRKATESLDPVTINILNQYQSLDKFKSGASIQKLIKWNHLKDSPDIWFRNFFQLFDEYKNQEEIMVQFVSILGNSSSPQNILNRFLTNSTMQTGLLKILHFKYLIELLKEIPDLLLEDDIFTKKTKDKALLESELKEAYSKVNNNRYCQVESNIFFNFKLKEEFRIAVNELIHNINPYQTEQDLTILFEIIFKFIYKLSLDCLIKSYGTIQKSQLAILTLNTLASKELDFDSAIQMLFLYDGNGNHKSNGNISLDIHEYYSKLATLIIESFQVKDKPIFRLSYPKTSDKSLKPSIYTVDEYFHIIQKNESIINRFNLLNIRWLAGDQNFSESIIVSLVPYVYKKYLSLSDIDEIQHLLSQYSEGINYNPLGSIKIMTQVYQFFSGANYLTISNIKNGIRLLLDRGVISEKEYDTLNQANFIFKRIRHIEKLLNWGHPSLCALKKEEIDNLLSKTHCADLYNFIIHCNEHNNNIQTIFKEHFETLLSKKNQDNLVYSLLEGNEEAIQYLATFGFKDLNKTLSLLKELIPSTATGKEKFAVLFPILIGELSRSADPDLLLINLVKVVQSYNAKESFLELISEDSIILHTLAKLFTNSPYLTEILIQYPELFEKLNDLDFFLQKNSKIKLKRQLTSFRRIFPFEKAVLVFKHFATFRIGLKNLHGSSDLIQTLAELSNLAEIILYQSVLYFKHKMEKEKNIKAGSISIILLGKLGGRELNIGSDLDIIFIFDEEKELSNGYFTSQFWSELIAELSSFFNQASTMGNLYEIDLKLRPEGRNAPLCHSLQKFEDYLTKKGDIWEKLVYTKARVLSNHSGFKKEIKRVISSFVFAPIDYNHLKNEVAHMRKRISDNAQKKSGAKFLFKKGKGGLLDLEFLAEFLVIFYGRENPDLRKKNIFNMYHALKNNNIIDQEDYNIAIRALLFLRQIEMTLRIMNNMSYDKLPEDPEELSKLASKLKIRHEDLLLNDYLLISNQVNQLYKKYLL